MAKSVRIMWIVHVTDGVDEASAAATKYVQVSKHFCARLEFAGGNGLPREGIKLKQKACLEKRERFWRAAARGDWGEGIGT